MYKEKVNESTEQLKKVQQQIKELQALEQRLIGRLLTLEELQNDTAQPTNGESAVAGEPIVNLD